MNDDDQISVASRSYARAHHTHYGSMDLQQALGLYEEIVAAHPDIQEAAYSRSQIQNIAKAVVPAHELFAAQAALAHSHLARVKQAQAAKVPPESSSAGAPR